MWTRFRSRPRSTDTRRGMALLTAIIVILAYTGLSLTYFLVSTSTVQQAERRETSMRMEAAATSAAQVAAQEVWNEYVRWNGGEAGGLETFRDYLASDAATLALPPGAQGAAFGEAVDVRSLINPELDGEFGDLVLELATARRRDTSSTTDIEVTVGVATSTAPLARRATIRQSFTVGGEEYAGFEYALLTNNVNCIMCHARFDNANRYFNGDLAELGSFDRIKIGTLETLQIRPDDAMSAVFGTIHSRGSLFDDAGAPLSSLSGTSLTGAELGPTGKILEDDDGSIYADDLTLASGDPLPEYGQLYLDYPEDLDDMTDGELPTSFPPAIPDVDGDGVVDPAEFAIVAEDAHGTLKGTIISVEDGSTFNAAWSNGSIVPQVDGTTNDHVVLVGTPDHPIEINGKVAIDGDVVIFGVVKGEGAIYASGNVYIAGDLTYADGVDVNGYRTFGVAADGTPNALALAAGGNIVAGDHTSIPSWGSYKDNPVPVTGDENGSFNFTMNEIATFNRREWAKTQPTLPGIDGAQVPNPGYDPNHVPTYYTMNEGNPVFVMNGAGLPAEKQSKLYFDAESGLWKGVDYTHKYSDELFQKIEYSDVEYQQANIEVLAPDDGWLSSQALAMLRAYAEATHPVGPMQIDALLYTNHAAFAMVRNLSKYQGQVVLNGGLVAADTGVLSPGGIQVNFDSRPSEFVDLWDLTKPVALRRAVWQRVGESTLASAN